MWSIVEVFLLLGVLLGGTQSDPLVIKSNFPTTSEEYIHGLPLDETENYFLYWKFDDQSITFEVHVRTKGWVGLGLSSSWGMAASDIVIGWVKDGKGHMKVCCCRIVTMTKFYYNFPKSRTDYKQK